MEQGKVTGYDQVDYIDRIRRANAQKHVVQGSQTQMSPIMAREVLQNLVDLCPINFFNQGSCSHHSTHENRGVVYKHICAHCFTSSRNKKKTNSKNDEVRA